MPQLRAVLALLRHCAVLTVDASIMGGSVRIMVLVWVSSVGLRVEGGRMCVCMCARETGGEGREGRGRREEGLAVVVACVGCVWCGRGGKEGEGVLERGYRQVC